MKTVSYNKRLDWIIPTALIVLSLVPAVGGAFRMTQLVGGAEVTPDNARFFASPLPVMLHIFSVIIYSILGAFQFAPGFRRRKPKWHRTAGRILIPCGLGTAITGLWMTLFYPWPEGDGEILYGMRLIVVTAMLVSILLGIVAIRQRKFAQHGNWMIRAYALAMGAGTQVLVTIPWFLLFGFSTPGEFTRAMLMGAGWVINVLVAEWIIYRGTSRPKRQVPVAVSSLARVQKGVLKIGWRGLPAFRQCCTNVLRIIPTQIKQILFK